MSAPDDFDEKEAILLEVRDFAIRIAQAGYPTLGSALAHLGACAALNCEKEAHAQLEALSNRVVALCTEGQQVPS